MRASIFSGQSLCLPAPKSSRRAIILRFYSLLSLLRFLSVRLAQLLFISAILIPPFNLCGMPLVHL